MTENLVILTSSLGGGGAERLAAYLSRVLRKDFDIYICSLSEQVDYAYNGVLNIFGKSAPQRNPLASLVQSFRRFNDLYGRVHELSPAYVVSFSHSTNMMNALMPGRTVTSIHGIIEDEAMPSWEYDLVDQAEENAYVRASDAIVGVSSVIEDRLLQKYPSARSRYTTIWNCVDHDMVESKKYHNQHLDPTFKQWCSQDVPIVVNMGRMVEFKGQNSLIKGVKAAREETELKLVVIGDGRRREQLEQLVCRLNLEEDVLFTGFEENPFPYLANADVYMHYLSWSGINLSLLEAAACGLPLVCPASDLGTNTVVHSKTEKMIPDDITHCDHGILTPPCSLQKQPFSIERSEAEEKLGKALQGLLEDSDLRSKYGEAAYDRSREFGLNRWKKDWMNLLGQI